MRAPSCRLPDRQNGVQVGSLHQALGVDMRVEELAAEGLEGPDGIECRQRQRGFPPVDDYLAISTVDGSNDPLEAYGISQASGKDKIRTATLEEGRPRDDLLGARRQKVFGPRDAPNPAAHAARQPARDLTHERHIVPDAHRRIEVDDLHLREALEAPHPAKHILVSQGEPFALNELDDRTVLQINGWNEHCGRECRVQPDDASTARRSSPHNERSTRRARRRRLRA